MIIEAKGLGRNGGFDRDAQNKMIAVKAQHPEVDFKIVFMKDGRVNPPGSMTASEWATKYGFDYSIGVIPKEWMT